MKTKMRVRFSAWMTAAGGLLLLASMFLPRVRPEAGEDFFQTYYHADGPPSSMEELPNVDAWFVTVPALGTLMLVLIGLGLAGTALLRPELALRLGPAAAWTGALLSLWVLATTVLFPGLDAPPFERLPATWLGLAATLTTAAGLVGL
jgi:heme/copper-type cytochrome/quinol oxidase subunit 1